MKAPSFRSPHLPSLLPPYVSYLAAAHSSESRGPPGRCCVFFSSAILVPTDAAAQRRILVSVPPLLPVAASILPDLGSILPARARLLLALVSGPHCEHLGGQMRGPDCKVSSSRISRIPYVASRHVAFSPGHPHQDGLGPHLQKYALQRRRGQHRSDLSSSCSPVGQGGLCQCVSRLTLCNLARAGQGFWVRRSTYGMTERSSCCGRFPTPAPCDVSIGSDRLSLVSGGRSEAGEATPRRPHSLPAEVETDGPGALYDGFSTILVRQAPAAPKRMSWQCRRSEPSQVTDGCRARRSFQRLVAGPHVGTVRGALLFRGTSQNCNRLRFSLQSTLTPFRTPATSTSTPLPTTSSLASKLPAEDKNVPRCSSA